MSDEAPTESTGRSQAESSASRSNTERISEVAEKLRMESKERRKGPKCEIGRTPPVPTGMCGLAGCAEGCLANCTTCCDLGWLTAEYYPGIERKIYGPRRCPDCEFADEAEQLGRFRSMTLANIGFLNGREPVGTLKSFDPTVQAGTGRDQARRALDAANRWGRDEGPSLLLLIGDTRIGKTHLAEGVAEYLGCTRKKRVILLTGDELALKLGRYLSEDPAGKLDLERRMRQVDYLILDDVGNAYGTGGERSKYMANIMEQVVKSRFDNGLPTFITGNLGDEEDIIQTLGERTLARLKESERALTVDMWEMRSVAKSKSGTPRLMAS